MKTKTIFIVAIFLLLNILEFAHAEENYWNTIKGFYLEKNNRSQTELASYLEKLTAEELIIAGRQASKEAELICPEQVFCEESCGMLEFFSYWYPQSGGLNNLNNLLQEIRDKTQTNFWRASLFSFLDNTKWEKHLTVEQIYAVINNAEIVLSDETEHPRLRYEASETTRELLDQLEKNNLLVEAVIQKKLESGSQLRDLIKEIIDGKITLSDNYKQAQAKTMKCYNSYAQVLLLILNEPELKPILQRGVLRGLKTSLGQQIESAAQVRNTLGNTIRNYHKFDKEYWSSLARIGHEDLNLPDSNNIAQNMLNDLQNELKIEKDEKKKNQIQNEIKSFERITKQQEFKRPDDPNAAKK